MVNLKDKLNNILVIYIRYDQNLRIIADVKWVSFIYDNKIQYLRFLITTTHISKQYIESLIPQHDWMMTFHDSTTLQ